MENGLHTVVEFGENDKWFVLAEKVVNGFKYSYLVRVNQTEDDFIDEYQVVKSYFNNNDEYMDVVNGDELKEVMPLLIPEAKEYIENPEMLKQIFND